MADANILTIFIRHMEHVDSIKTYVMISISSYWLLPKLIARMRFIFFPQNKHQHRVSDLICTRKQ